ncbi:MAG TPA: hypothetical protein VHE78_05450 [Gemmatimonadaceae bacterium]|nr:hypothetical protein [Gemmatimonadaceae bacterium]
MSLWNKVSNELRNAGKAAAGAIDEGKVRLELFRVRQLADKAAQALGYEVHRARKAGVETDSATILRLEVTLTEHETEAKRLEEELERHRASNAPPPPPPPPPPAPASAEASGS